MALLIPDVKNETVAYRSSREVSIIYYFTYLMPFPESIGLV